MRKVDEELWKGFGKAVTSKGTITGAKPVPGGTTYSFRDEAGQDWNLSLRPRTAYVIGIDTVGYSRRSLNGQLLLTTWLFSIIQRSIENLRNINWIPNSQPCVLIPTGDGAMIVIDDDARLDVATALIYHVQMWVEDINRRHLGQKVSSKFNKSQPYPIVPIQCRYALAKGEIILMKGLNKELNTVGPGMVTCARILAASKGAHFLVEAEVQDDYDALGGIDGVQQQGDPWNWWQRLHSALMPEKKVKTATLTFYNVFGKFKPGPLIVRTGGSRGDAEGVPWYNLGSHDVSTIVG